MHDAEQRALKFACVLAGVLVGVQALVLLAGHPRPRRRGEGEAGGAERARSLVIAGVGILAFSATEPLLDLLSEVYLDPALEEGGLEAFDRSVMSIAVAAGAALLLGRNVDLLLHRLSRTLPRPNPVSDLLGVAAGLGLLLAARRVREAYAEKEAA